MTPNGSLAAYRAASSKLDNLTPQALAVAQSLIQAGLISPEQVTSGYRSPQRNADVGGAENSQHLTGNAFDIGGQLTNEQRSAILQHAIAKGAKGVGLYPGGSLHFDTRETPAFWGVGGSYRGATADQAPEWARPHIAGLLGQQIQATAPTSAAAAPQVAAASSGQPAASPAAPMGLLAGAIPAQESAADRDAYQRQVMGLLSQATGANEQPQQQSMGLLSEMPVQPFPQIQIKRMQTRRRA